MTPERQLEIRADACTTGRKDNAMASDKDIAMHTRIENELRRKPADTEAQMEALIEAMGSDGEKYDAAIIPRACRVIGELRARNIVLVGHVNAVEAEYAKQIERMRDRVRSLEAQNCAPMILTRDADELETHFQLMVEAANTALAAIRRVREAKERSADND